MLPYGRSPSFFDIPLLRRRKFLHRFSVLFLTSVLSPGCVSNSHKIERIQMNGSDTMVNLAQGWAERWHRREPEVEVQVLGAGSGIGIADLADGKCELANSSRPVKKKEYDLIVQKRGVSPIGHIVGYDAMAVYVHPDNPIKTLTLEQLAEIYGDQPRYTRWSQLTGKPSRYDEIIPIARQNSSGTYSYFRDAVIGTDKNGQKRDYRLGTVDANGSKDVVALVSSSPSAIGYSGMGYKTDTVNWLALSLGEDKEAYIPTLENARNGLYPITRPLIVYTAGEPSKETSTSRFLDWIYSEEGQQLVTQMGYVPVDHRENLKHVF